MPECHAINNLAYMRNCSFFDAELFKPFPGYFRPHCVVTAVEFPVADIVQKRAEPDGKKVGTFLFGYLNSSVQDPVDVAPVMGNVALEAFLDVFLGFPYDFLFVHAAGKAMLFYKFKPLL
jgi:hypothetical protein